MGAVTAAAIATVGVFAIRARRDSAPAPPPVAPAVIAAQAPLRAPRFTRVTFTRDITPWVGAKFAPDGQTFLFTRRFPFPSRSIHIGRIGSEESRPLGLENATLHDVSRTGELLIKRYESHFVGGWELGTLSRISMTGGTPRDIASNVFGGSWAPDGKNIVAIRFASGRFALEYPLGTPLYTSSSELRYARISPRGDRIAFVEWPTPGDTRGSVAVVDLAGRRKQLTRVFRAVECLVWAPDGSKIYFNAVESELNASIWEVTLDGREKQLVGTTDNLTLADVAADGRLLVARVLETLLIRAHRRGDARDHDLSGYAWPHVRDISDDGERVTIEDEGTTQGPDYKIYLRRTDGSPPVLLGEGISPRLSPDGSHIVTGSIVSPALIRIIPIGAGPSRELPPHGLKERWQAMWMPDGRRVIYSGVDSAGVRRLHVQDVDGGPPRAFGPEGATFEWAPGSVVSPDGRWVAARAIERAWILVALDGAKLRPIPSVRRDESIRQWTDDGRFLYVAGPPADPLRIDKLELTSGRRSRFMVVGGKGESSWFGIGSIFLNRSGTAWVYASAQVKADLYVIDLSPPQ